MQRRYGRRRAALLQRIEEFGRVDVPLRRSALTAIIVKVGASQFFAASMTSPLTTIF